MIRKKPVTGLDPVMEAGFPKGSCSTKMPECNRFERKRLHSSLKLLRRKQPAAAPDHHVALRGGRAYDPEDHGAHGAEQEAQDNGLHQTQSPPDRIAK
jgi:hypothetical protein